VRLARPKPFDLMVGFTPKLDDVNADVKRKCVECGYLRSFTIMTDGDVCGKCISPRQNDALQRMAKNGIVDRLMREANCEERPAESTSASGDLGDAQSKSHLVECYTCQAIYAVVDVASLNVRPKCHYCRQGVPCENVPVVNCRVCLNRWVRPNPTFFGSDGKADEWVCPCCTLDAKKATTAVSVDFGQLCRMYPMMLPTLFDVHCPENDATVMKDLFSPMSLYKLYMKHTETLFPSDDGADEKKAEQSMEQRVECVVNALTAQGAPKYKGKIIHNLAALVQSVASAVSSGKLSAVCCLCFAPKQLIALESACGACNNLMCFECLGTWYSQLQPGRVVLPSHLLCPFCKCRPQSKTLKKYNKQVCTIIKSRVELNTKWYHAWCVDCYQIKQAVQRECLRESLPTLNEFRCEQCTEAALAKQSDDADFVAKNSKKCPACEAPTVKVSGCNHITCRCGAHWCYQCGKEFAADNIYEHMDEVHGGIDM